MAYILALDQGTTSSRAIVFDRQGAVKTVAQKEFRQIYPRPGWVEHDPEEIWSSQASVTAEAIVSAGAAAGQIEAIGITNQRETTVVWDRATGRPIHNAIVWQDRRTAELCDRLRDEGHVDLFRDRTGLVLDAYFSGTKVRWILENVDGARERAERGELAFGTIDSWLIWRLSGGSIHLTDVSNASRTLMFNIHDGDWDDELLCVLDVPRSMLPEVRSSSEVYGTTSGELLAKKIPIAGIAGDQQAALFGQVCTEPGMAKNTYGTGCFMVLNTGLEAVPSHNNLLTTVAWKRGTQTTYALEGSVFIAGAVVQWLRDGLGMIRESSEIEGLAGRVEDNGGIYLVPAFVGLGAPHWDQYARGTMVGLTRGTTSAHIARAALESMAYQTADVLAAMRADSGLELAELRVDGGAAANDMLMQFQADMLGVPVVRPEVQETTALGAAYLAGLAVGFWSGVDEIAAQWTVDRRFEPEMPSERVQELIAGWHKAVERAKGWAE
ncbi:MAG: glycerol kinase GlpK [Holophagae bacterium]|jgi:glycerol kinase